MPYPQESDRFVQAELDHPITSWERLGEIIKLAVHLGRPLVANYTGPEEVIPTPTSEPTTENGRRRKRRFFNRKRRASKKA